MSCNLKQDISIGKNLKLLRKRMKLTQAEAAAQLQVLGIDITPEILAKMEQGKYSVKVSVLLAMKRIYQVDTFDQFFEDLTETMEYKMHKL